ncbi:MAG TPA: chemotaxis protein CheW [Steroidobacteraceae bacterium]|nr:chemotaxis protein CheW [Steroidobacteraceae bacterium]
MSAADGRSVTAELLRRQFDAAFAAPARIATDTTEGMLAVRIGADPFALRLGEIAGLHADLTIVPVPSSSASLLGIVGIRGTLRPIYDLAALLGYGGAGAPRWLIFPQAAPAIGLAFAALEAHVKVPKESVQDEQAQTAAAARAFARGVARVGSTLRPIIHLESVLKVIKDEVP